MPIGDVSYQDAALDALVNSWPASGAEYHLYSVDPTTVDDPTTVELDSTGGYAPVAFARTDFAAAADGLKSAVAEIGFGTSTDAWSDVGNFWAIVDSGGLIVYYDEVDDPIEVDEAGQTPGFTPSLLFGVGA